MTDGSSLKGVQIIVDNSLENYEMQIKTLGLGSAIQVKGEIKESQGKGQRIEILAKCPCARNITNRLSVAKEGSISRILRSKSHLRARTNIIGAATRVRGAGAQAIYNFFERNGFHYIRTPIITASDCEGGWRNVSSNNIGSQRILQRLANNKNL